MGRYRQPAPSIVQAYKALQQRVSQLERIPRAPNTTVNSGAITLTSKAAIIGTSAYAPMGSAQVQRIANPADFPAIQTYYNNPVDGDKAGNIINLDVFTSGTGTYFYEASLSVNDYILQRVAGCYNVSFGVVEFYRIIGITSGVPTWVWKDTSMQQSNYRTVRGGFTHHLAVSTDITTGAVSGNPYSILQFTGSSLPIVRSGYVYAVRIGGAASCAISASMAKFDLMENWVSTSSPGNNRGFWSDINAGAVAGFRVAVPGTVTYLANGSGSDYTFTNNLTVTLTPATNNAWTVSGPASVSTPFYASIERVGHVSDTDGWPEAFYVA